MNFKPSERDYLDRCRSLAVFGGTFDPIHMGHLAIAKRICQELNPQRVLFIPSSRPAHKQSREITSAQHRYNMTAMAVCEHPSFDISRLELDRTGVSYTIDTARALKSICPTGAKISFVIGADALMDILSWKDAAELLKTCEFIVIPRPGYENRLHEYVDNLTRTYRAKIYDLEGPLLDISSTNIRERFKEGRSVEGLVPRQVEDYVRRHGLYSAKRQGGDVVPSIDIGPEPGKFMFVNALESLRSRLSPKRFTHTVGVISEAERLAIYYKQDIEKARIAALLHDCAKEYSADKKRALCRLWGIQLDEVLETGIDLTHSLLGAESAKRDFNIHDPEILQAIRYHTTGHKDMTMLDKIIALADYIEPYRANWGPTNEMRRLALKDINQALILGTEYTMQEEQELGRPIHPWSREMLKALKEEKSK